jgi:putative nucleotidyltransferase with HDIG domain
VKIRLRMLTTRIGHRILLLFVLCALVPIVTLAVVSYREVVSELRAQSARRLRESTKMVGLSVYNRILLLEHDLRASGLDQDLEGASGRGTDEPAAARFEQVFTVSDTEMPAQLRRSGETENAVQERLRWLRDGGSVLLSQGGESGRPRVTLFVRNQRPTLGAETLGADINPRFLWGGDGGGMVPAGYQACWFDDRLKPLFASFPGCSALPALLGNGPNALVSGRVGLTAAGTEYLAGYRRVFLKGRFSVRDWVVVLCESKASVLAPVAQFRRVFPPVVLMTLWVVILLSLITLRKTLDPLDRLKAATGHLADRDFQWRVDVNSGDEFEELASAFNDMAGRLKNQFKTQAMIAELHRTILSALDPSLVVEATISGVLKTLECELACVALSEDIGGTITLYTGRSGATAVERSTHRLTQRDRERMSEEGTVIDLADRDDSLRHLTDADGELATVILAPVALRRRGPGALILGWRTEDGLGSSRDLEVRRLADQLEVALANSSLVQELGDLTWGTLQALARAVDAKSSWTAGHSERVTQIALEIGREMGLSPEELRPLRSGALLHDIGKIGVPRQILDKPSTLDGEELRAIRSHPLIGERILEPIAAFEEALPIISQHHERFDGSGYPRGVTGAAIDIKARILAVADVYDAMTTVRPYRQARSHETAVATIREGSGSQFDPAVVGAFLRIIESSGQPGRETALPPSDVPAESHEANSSVAGGASGEPQSTRDGAQPPGGT